jgi:hypothetical protein
LCSDVFLGERDQKKQIGIKTKTNKDQKTNRDQTKTNKDQKNK